MGLLEDLKLLVYGYDLKEYENIKKELDETKYMEYMVGKMKVEITEDLKKDIDKYVKEELWEDIRNELRNHRKLNVDVQKAQVRAEVAKQLCLNDKSGTVYIEPMRKEQCPFYSRGAQCSPTRKLLVCKHCECYNGKRTHIPGEV